MSSLAVKANEQRSKLVYPGETALRGEAALVDVGVEEALASAFGSLAIALVFWDVRDQAMIETGLARLTGVKSGIGVEVRATNG